MAAPKRRARQEPFGYCLNTSTIGGIHHLKLTEKIDIAAKAGYNAIEPWIREIDEHIKGGGKVRDLARRIEDHGMTVESSIGFSEWIVNDASRRKRGLEDARRSMDLVRQIGGKRMAAPPAGATDLALDLSVVTDRYRKLLELGDRFEVAPEVELWGFSKTLTRLSDAAWVAIQSDHPRACVLPDVFHLYKGGSGFEGMRLLGPDAYHVIHVNDYPAQPPRARITDAQRVFPGDGIAPYKNILRTMRMAGFHGVLSLELFNREYWKRDPLTVARTGLEKMRALVRSLR
jgi:2-keto-myo-inositol isomerase